MRSGMRLVAFILAVVMVLPCALVTSVPASAAESNWIVSSYTGNDGLPTKILSETSETWIVDTVTVEFGKQVNSKKETGGYIQSTQKLTDLIGHGGADGRGFVQVVVEDGSLETQNRGYFYVQLTGSSDASTPIVAPRESQNNGVSTSTAGMTWYFHHNGTEGLISKNHAVNATAYGKLEDIAAHGYKLSFTEIDGHVIPRSSDNAASYSMTSYNSTKFGSDMTLEDIGGEDGTYVRIQSQTGSLKLKCTITIAYPKPENYDYNASHWVAMNGSKILSESTETWKLDTVSVEMAKTNSGFVQHKQPMNNLIGSNNFDGRGWVNVVFEDGTWDNTLARGYHMVQFVGDGDASDLYNRGAAKTPTNTMSWYMRNRPETGTSMIIMRSDHNTNVQYHDDTTDKSILAASGIRLAFAQNADGYVVARSSGIGTASGFFYYADASANKMISKQTLSALPRDEQAGEDDVFLRIQTVGSSSRLKCTASVFYPVSDIESVQPEITDSITLHWNAMLAETPAVAPVMKFAMEGKEEVAVVGKAAGDSRWTFAYTDILPQDLGKNIQASLYDGEGEDATLLSTCVYSMETYCRNKMINNTANKDNAALWAVLLSMLDYGAEAQTYFGEEGTLVNASVREAFVQGYHATGSYPIPYTTVEAQLATIDTARKAEMSEADAVTTLIAGDAANGYEWQKATLSLQDYVKVRFKFTAPVDENFSVKMKVGDDQEYTAEYTLANGGIIKSGGSYYVYTDGISVSDFATEFTAAFFDGENQIGQTVTYSVNTYIKWMSGQTVETADAYNLVQALYNYSVSAVAYNG